MTLMKVMSLAKFYTLLMLSRKPRHGYELLQELEHAMGKRISQGVIYPFLAELKRQGCVQVQERESREKKVYALTARGKKLLDRLIEQFGVIIEAAVGRKLRACVHCGCQVYSGGYVEKVGKQHLHFCCTRCAKSYVREMGK